MSVDTIDSHTLHQWLLSDQVVLVDVREPAEHASAHIVGSLLHPLSKISTQDIPTTNKKIVLYCQKGMRGKQACEKITADNSIEVYNLEGGLADWTMQGYPTQSSGKHLLPLDRQVQITVGSAVFISSVLAYSMEPTLLWISAFFGAGLAFAGLTGTCALARVLAAMPWNK